MLGGGINGGEVTFLCVGDAVEPGDGDVDSRAQVTTVQFIESADGQRIPDAGQGSCVGPCIEGDRCRCGARCPSPAGRLGDRGWAGAKAIDDALGAGPRPVRSFCG